MMEAIRWMLWTPHWSYDRVDEQRCRASVSDGPRDVVMRQCSRRVAEEIGGYGWCLQHADQLRQRMEGRS
jgi:hypothetical protein